jgi:hypothetical protein
MIELTFLGGAHTVTGSKHLVRTGDDQRPAQHDRDFRVSGRAHG